MWRAVGRRGPRVGAQKQTRGAMLVVNVLLVIHLAVCRPTPVRASPISLPPTNVSQAARQAAHQQHQLDTQAAAAAAPLPDQTLVTNSSNTDTKALNYLQKYGYMNANLNAGANNLISEDSFASAISSFQRFAGLPETGFADELTLQYMELPRCGNRDLLRARDDGSGALGRARRRRRKRYALQGSKWRRQELTYRISQYPSRFSGRRDEVDAQIERALALWSRAAPIDFVVKREGRVHIDIRFASGDHGDGDAFDGPGNTLAHAYFPQYGGDAHFDDQELWTVDSHAGTNIFQVAAHELGHSLGLGHSSVREALMAPFYQKYKPDFKLHGDDVLAIQALYGEKPSQPETMGSLSWPSHPRGHQHHLSPAAGARTGILSSSAATTPTTTTSTSTTARPTNRFEHEPAAHQFWPIGSIVPGEASTRAPPSRAPERGHQDGREINDNDADPGEDAAASQQVPSIPARGITAVESAQPGEGALPADLCSDPSIDAATRTHDGNFYVFKGHNYWQLGQDGLLPGFPRSISADWDQLPGQLDAALTWADGKTFFFKGNKYWRFRNRRREVGYPKLISQGFAGVPDHLDAALVWGGNGRTYFFKGAEYWRFNSKADPPVGPDYPRSMKLWHGVPVHVDAALRWHNNVTYFFKGPRYYRFNDREFKVEQKARPAYPRSTGEWWFGCGPSNHLAQRSPPAASNLREPANATAGWQREDIDWSFFAGLQPETRIQGTHISDQRPVLVGEEQQQQQHTRQLLGLAANFLSSLGAPNSAAAASGLHLCDYFQPLYTLASLLIAGILSRTTHLCTVQQH